MKNNTWYKRINDDTTVYTNMIRNYNEEITIMMFLKSDGWYYKAFDLYVSPCHIKMNATTFNEAQAEIKMKLREHLQQQVEYAKTKRDLIVNTFLQFQYEDDEVEFE